MKRIIFLLFLSLSLLAFFPSISLAQDSVIKEATMSGETESSQSGEIDYPLPYPGILSDSPLYFLKAIRDKVVELLISDPVKKAEFYLLQADKRLNEGQLLFEKGESKYQMAESVISKGENYFEKGIGQLQLARKQNLAVDSLIQKYILSSSKHEEVIKSLSQRSKGSVNSGLSRSQQRPEQFEKMLKELIPRK